MCGDPREYEEFEREGAHRGKCPSVVGNVGRGHADPKGQIPMSETLRCSRIRQIVRRFWVFNACQYRHVSASVGVPNPR